MGLRVPASTVGRQSFREAYQGVRHGGLLQTDIAGPGRQRQWTERRRGALLAQQIGTRA